MIDASGPSVEDVHNTNVWWPGGKGGLSATQAHDDHRLAAPLNVPALNRPLMGLGESSWISRSQAGVSKRRARRHVAISRAIRTQDGPVSCDRGTGG